MGTANLFYRYYLRPKLYLAYPLFSVGCKKTAPEYSGGGFANCRPLFAQNHGRTAAANLKGGGLGARPLNPAVYGKPPA